MMLVCQAQYQILSNPIRAECLAPNGWQEVTHLFTASDALALVQLAILPLVIAYSYRVISRFLFNR